MHSETECDACESWASHVRSSIAHGGQRYQNARANILRHMFHESLRAAENRMEYLRRTNTFMRTLAEDRQEALDTLLHEKNLCLAESERLRADNERHQAQCKEYEGVMERLRDHITGVTETWENNIMATEDMEEKLNESLARERKLRRALNAAKPPDPPPIVAQPDRAMGSPLPADAGPAPQPDPVVIDLITETHEVIDLCDSSSEVDICDSLSEVDSVPKPAADVHPGAKERGRKRKGESLNGRRAKVQKLAIRERCRRASVQSAKSRLP